MFFLLIFASIFAMERYHKKVTGNETKEYLFNEYRRIIRTENEQHITLEQLHHCKVRYVKQTNTYQLLHIGNYFTIHHANKNTKELFVTCKDHLKNANCRQQ